MRIEGWKLPQLNFKNPWLVAMVTERYIPLPWQQANTEVCCWDWGFGTWPEGVVGGGWAWAIVVVCVLGGWPRSPASHIPAFPGARNPGWAPRLPPAVAAEEKDGWEPSPGSHLSPRSPAWEPRGEPESA